jgi:hypothetical protein
MSTLPNSSVDSNSFSSAGLPDELSPAAYAQFEAENNGWIDQRLATEAEREADQKEWDYQRAIEQVRRGNEQLAALTAKANREQAAFDAEFDAFIEERKSTACIPWSPFIETLEPITFG